MPEIIAPAGELGRKFLRQGLPRAYVARVVREFDEHREDLEREARVKGLSPEGARSAAREKLGDLEQVAKALSAAKRRSYWWGRHPLVSFLLLPLPVFLFVFLGLVLLGAKLSGVMAWSENRHSVPEPNWAVIRFGFYTVLGMSVTATASLMWYLARRCHCGFRWAVTGCAVVFAHALFFHTGFDQPHGTDYGHFWIGYRLRGLTFPELIAWIVPLLLFVLYYSHLRRVQLPKTSD